MSANVVESLVIKSDKKIVFLIIDGLGGLPNPDKSELQTANIPNLDAVAAQSATGLLIPIALGVTPGSGPAHFALFGYDPVENNIGRGILGAAGIDFPLEHNDIAARINFATIDKQGRVVDRRAGRISTETNGRLCEKLRASIKPPQGVQVFIEPEKEHRAAMIFRGEGLSGDIADTDPQKVGVEPLPPRAIDPEAKRMERVVAAVLQQAKKILSDEEKANMILLRGFAAHRKYPTLQERFGLKPLAIAVYPMYRGLARLVGMEVLKTPKSMPDEFDALEAHFADYDFFFVHLKDPDSRGEDKDFSGKVKALEYIDSFIPRVLKLKPDVLVVTGDHSTPALIGTHSWHPVPVALMSDRCRRDTVKQFDEESCLRGSLGIMRSVDLMPLALANADKLTKFGA